MINEELSPPVEVPAESLNEETVLKLIDSFIFREGTDYGNIEASLETKRQQILKMLGKNKIKIVFDPNTESATIMTAEDWRKLTSI
jgi:uncharacterized protein YheU (UPF0270 family)